MKSIQFKGVVNQPKNQSRVIMIPYLSQFKQTTTRLPYWGYLYRFACYTSTYDTASSRYNTARSSMTLGNGRAILSFQKEHHYNGPGVPCSCYNGILL